MWKSFAIFLLILFFRHTADSSYNDLIKNLHLSGVNYPMNQNNGQRDSEQYVNLVLHGFPIDLSAWLEMYFLKAVLNIDVTSH